MEQGEPLFCYLLHTNPNLICTIPSYSLLSLKLKNVHTHTSIYIQLAFTLTFLQELIQGKGVCQGLAEGDPVNFVFLGAFAVSTIGLTAFLAIKGDDDYTLDDAM